LQIDLLFFRMVKVGHLSGQNAFRMKVEVNISLQVRPGDMSGFVKGGAIRALRGNKGLKSVAVRHFGCKCSWFGKKESKFVDLQELLSCGFETEKSKLYGPSGGLLEKE